MWASFLNEFDVMVAADFERIEEGTDSMARMEYPLPHLIQCRIVHLQSLLPAFFEYGKGSLKSVEGSHGILGLISQ